MNTRIKAICSIALAGALLFTTSTVVAKEKQVFPLAAYGEGGASCGSYVESKQDQTERYFYFAWVNGFLTGVNRYQKSEVKIFNGLYDVKRGRDDEALMLWLDNYCNKNPLDSFFRAVIMLKDELQK